MMAVSLVLLLIIFSTRFATYLAEAALGKLDGGVLLTLMAYKSLIFLELILPLGLFVGILLSYGRLYMESEMTVLSACGLSERRLLGYTMMTTFCVAILVSFLGMYLGPQGVKASEALLAEQRNRTDFETLKSARFNELDGGRGIVYSESLSKDKKQLNRVFMAEIAQGPTGGTPVILMAESGQTVIDTEFGQKFLMLKNGRRYLGRPGEADYETVAFEQFYQLLPEPDYAIGQRAATDGLSTVALFNEDTDSAKAALQWRLSLPVMVMIVGFLAVPLSKTQPRKGRYGKLLPAIMIYIIYLVSLNAGRGMLDSGKAPTEAILWVIHLAFFLLGVVLYTSHSWLSFVQRKVHKTPSAEASNHVAA